MKTRTHVLFLATTLLAIAVPTLHAQVVNDGATNTLNNGTHIFTGDVTVGTNGSFTLLILTNNAWLTNSGHGYVGRNPGANTNTVRLAGPDTRWRMSGDLFAGRDGAGNQLLVSNDSVVRNHDGYVGYGVTSSSNLALVTGAGSFWTNVATLYVGFQGAGNQLVLSNDAVVGSSSGYLGYFSAGNVAVVTGTNSLWANALEFAVGYNGGANQLAVNNGGLVRDADGYLGYGSASGGNMAVVTGPGSLWVNDFGLSVGYISSGNHLVVSNGGAVRDYSGYIGTWVQFSNNTALVTGTGSLWTNLADLVVGEAGTHNKLVVTNGGVVRNTTGTVGKNSGAHFNLALVTGTGSLWTNSGNLLVGSNGAFNQLIISAGGRARAAGGYIGYSSNSANNSVVVTGAGSLWTNGDGLIVGYEGMGNQLVVSNGAAVRNGSSYIGLTPTSGSNAVMVTDAGSRWTNQGSLYVGFGGSGNQLVVSNGGVVGALSGDIGDNTSDNNTVVVTGAGSRWENESVDVGSGGSGNRLVVSDGGVVWDEVANIGYSLDFGASSSNVVVVTGAGSLWTNESFLVVGRQGPGNQLVVSNGGVVHNSYGGIGYFGLSGNNVAVVTGVGSRWENQGELDVGIGGAGNQLVVTNGGVVRNTDGYLGFTYTSSSNVAVVTGTGSLWTNESALVVGHYSAGNHWW